MATPLWFDSSSYVKSKAEAIGKSELELLALFKNAGYEGADGHYRHFEEYGADEGLSPNSYFNADEYLYAKAVDYYKTSKVTGNNVKSMQMAIEGAGLSPWEHYVRYGAAEGINPSTSFDATKYMEDKLALMQKDEPGYTMEQLEKAFEDANLNPLTHYMAYGKGEGLTISAVSGAVTPGATYDVTTGPDSLFGTTGNDHFSAKLDTLSSLDYIDGGAGYDSLYAYLGKGSQDITPEIHNVEKIAFRLQQEASNSGDNNVSQGIGRAESIVDLGDTFGMKYLQNDFSRGTLRVENVQTNSNEMVVAWTNTDPGTNVDFGVYFDPQHLKAQDLSSSGILRIEIMDVFNGSLSAQPLKDQPYNKFNFRYSPDGGTAQIITLEFRAEDKDKYTGEKATYASFVEAFNNAIADYEEANPEVKGLFKAAIGENWNGEALVGGVSYSYDKGSRVLLTSESGKIEAGNDIAGTGWSADGVIPPNTGFVTAVKASFTESCPLIQTTIDLDNVGRVQWGDATPNCLPDNSVYGSEAGDMVVGSMATRGGVERFDVKVDRGSWLASLSSTNNALRMINVTHGDINGDGKIGHNTLSEANEEGAGQLYIGRSIPVGAAGDLTSWVDKQVLLSTAAGSGIKDVKAFDASAFTGTVNIAAELTNASFDKYMKAVDGTWGMGQNYAPDGDFSYKLGSAADVLNMKIKAGLAADRDFKLVVDAGAGDDLINFQFDDTSPQYIRDANALLVRGQKGVILNGGTGNDTVKVWGETSVLVNGGEGADAIYVSQVDDDMVWDNNTNAYGAGTEQNAVFIFNALENAAGTPTRDVIFGDTHGAQSMQNNIESTLSTVTYNNVNPGRDIGVSVTFKGIAGTTFVKIGTAAASTSATGNLSTTAVNKAIIEAINNDSVLSKLLVAKDGAGYSLLVESLIDGKLTLADNDLVLNFYSTNADGTRANFGPGSWANANSTDAYTTNFATHADDHTTLFDGTATGTQSLNRVDGGLGNDVIVLNANSGAEWYDTLVVSGEFGNDKVYNFQAAADKIAFSSTLGTIHHSVGSATPTTANSNTFTASELAGFANAGPAYWNAANAKGVAFVQHGASNLYTFFHVTNGNDTSGIAAGEVKILGTMQFDNDLGAALSDAVIGA